MKRGRFFVFSYQRSTPFFIVDCRIATKGKTEEWCGQNLLQEMMLEFWRLSEHTFCLAWVLHWLARLGKLCGCEGLALSI